LALAKSIIHLAPSR